ncbi:MAG: hypothetical protein UR66_C0002G0009 [Candidatus Moranbacteria bacterium GW2011_GWE1_35_17]|nr:MAG: hypothetical protein UR66_C0002G0009 [Candidatus Moranbacteria bacterium GW2011_GWE1_35_17]KKP70458.1 MAG: hypothetical protein UR65_C0041G0008 [Candidatus Moranbacteria bacterium GW2011_GWE2_35_164]KKP84620.1 MAG: hypothetical protein UR83_C0017G0016 [Candidatus Moranbacteria bacterium GW2011_GWF2_35_54]
MSRGGLNFFLALYIIFFLLLVTPFGALFFLIFGKASFFIALGTLALAIGVIYTQRQEIIKESMIFDLVVLLPVLATVIVGRLFWVKLNNKEIGSSISNEEVSLYLGILGLITLIILWLDNRRKK